MIHRQHQPRAIASLCAPLVLTAAAVAAEPVVTCTEGVEPLPIAYGAHSSGCSINPATDIDTFSFLGIAGDWVRIIVRGNTDGFDPVITLVDPNDEVLQVKSCTVGGFDRCTAVMGQGLVETGTYTLRISEGGANQTGSYILQIERLPPLFPPPAILFNSSRSGSISPVTDMDFLAFQGVPGTTIRIIGRGNTDGFDPHIEVFDPTGAYLASEWCTVGGFDQCSFSFDLTLETPGTYVIAMHEGGYNQTGSFEITLQCLTGNCACFEHDIDGDGAVGFQDLLQLLYSWGPCEGCPADLHADGVVDFNDLLLLLNSWGPCE